MRCDDSVTRIVEEKPYIIRRSRGYVPFPQRIPEELDSPHHILALGGELKDTISVYKNGYVVTSNSWEIWMNTRTTNILRRHSPISSAFSAIVEKKTWGPAVSRCLEIS
jgi:hydrogenase maturation factor HypF (carbamoyltransferase family)